MLNSSFLDVAIGIVFVFLLLSLIASSINEIILSFMNMRGKQLLIGLKTLLNDTNINVNGLVEKIYGHGQVFSLFRGNFDPNNRWNLPAYIPTTNFMMALLDVVPAAAAELDALPPAPAAPALDPHAAARAALLAAEAAAHQAALRATQVSAQLAAAPLGGPPEAQAAAAKAAAAEKLASLRVAAQKLANNDSTKKLGIPLLSMIDTAASDVDALKTHIEDWYNGAMDRVSGKYKFVTQWCLFGIGLILAITLNANTIDIVQQLSRDPTLREAIVAAAQSVKQPDDKSGQALKDQIAKVNEQVSKLDSIGIPFGWPPRKQGISWWEQNSDVLQRPGTWIGWLFTAIAVSLGAPFWFDMLNKIMIVRSTVKPGEKSPPAKDKEKK